MEQTVPLWVVVSVMSVVMLCGTAIGYVLGGYVMWCCHVRYDDQPCPSCGKPMLQIGTDAYGVVISECAAHGQFSMQATVVP